MARVAELLPDLDYDICVHDRRLSGQDLGPFAESLAGVALVRAMLAGPVYGVLGNHDTIRMVPGLEDMGVRMLMNEAETLERGGEQLHLAGIDDAHFFRVHNIEKVAAPPDPTSLPCLLSHTPEIYRQAAHAGFDLSWPGTPMAASSACRAASRSCSTPICPGARCRSLAAWRHGRLHLGRLWFKPRGGSAQLPARDHPAPAGARRPVSRAARGCPGDRGPATARAPRSRTARSSTTTPAKVRPRALWQAKSGSTASGT